jgi:hypothetical protein
MRVLPWAFDSAPYFAALVASSCDEEASQGTAVRRLHRIDNDESFIYNVIYRLGPVSDAR